MQKKYWVSGAEIRRPSTGLLDPECGLGDLSLGTFPEFSDTRRRADRLATRAQTPSETPAQLPTGCGSEPPKRSYGSGVRGPRPTPRGRAPPLHGPYSPPQALERLCPKRLTFVLCSGE